MEYLKTEITIFSGKSKCRQKGPKADFLDFFKILSIFFRRNNLSWKIILLLIFHQQSHIWQNCGSLGQAKIGVGMDDRGINCSLLFLRGIICSFIENSGKSSVMGTSRNSGVKQGDMFQNFWKVKKYTFSKNSSFCSLKLLVIILFKIISCYHLPGVAIEEKV